LPIPVNTAGVDYEKAAPNDGNAFPQNFLKTCSISTHVSLRHLIGVSDLALQ